jgi:hypothetical protein
MAVTGNGFLETILCAVGELLVIVFLELARLIAGLFFPSAVDEIQAAINAVDAAPCSLTL